MAKVEQKQPIVAEISEAIKDAASIVLVTYSGITVEQDTAMRKELREAGVSYKVYKNTMMKFAFKGTPCEELCKHLEGPNAIAISKDDATAPARMPFRITMKIVARGRNSKNNVASPDIKTTIPKTKPNHAPAIHP